MRELKQTQLGKYYSILISKQIKEPDFPVSPLLSVDMKFSKTIRILV